MQVQWKRLLIRGSIWLSIELLLTICGLDDLADYSEFLSDRYAAFAQPVALFTLPH